MLLRQVAQNLVPLSVKGDVEYVINRLDDGGWLIALLNNRGIDKPQHGILPTDYREAQKSICALNFRFRRAMNG